MRSLRVRCPGWQGRLTACGLACLAAANANGLSLTDPAGDAYESAHFSDIVEIEASEQAGGVLWTLEFVDLSQGVSGALLLDLDGDRRTGGVALSQITEAAIDFNVAILGICTAQLFTASGAEMLACSVEGNRLTVALPSTSLAPDPQTLQFSAVAASDFLCGGRDRIPDQGYARFRDGQVDVQALGAAPFTARYLTDPVDAEAPVDLRGVEVAIEGEHLVLRTRYHNPIDPFSIDVVTQGMLSLDLDRDLLTGFQGTSEVFPTFGVDAYVQYYVYPWALGGHTEVTLGVQDPRDPVEVGKLQVGSFFSDSCFRRLADGVEVSVPLARLPAVTGRSVVLAQTLEPVGDLWDRFPDAGGLVALDGAVIPFNACRSPELGVADPAGDSYAFGGDNDDLLGLHACYYEEGLLFRVRYTSLDLLGEALTSMSVDIDRSLATGEPTDNVSGSLILGAEYTLVSALSSNPGGRGVVRGSGDKASFFGGALGTSAFFTAILVEGSSGDLIRGTHALYTLDFGLGQAYITVPFRLIDGRTSLNAYVKTMSGAFGTATFDDEAPGSGVLAVVQDRDGDEVPDALDDCSAVANPDQRDTDADGYGNACDPDFNNDGVVSAADYLTLRARLNSNDALCDLNGDGKVSAADYLILRGWLNRPPGPSGVRN